MKILAVIPARAGSKGIPNKNIRILGGHPMVYYAIQNAVASAYITDVIVSTDSDDVRIIAQQLGVGCKVRDDDLCGDSITLDSVVYDAIPDGEGYDYIVTMQPTSPTLRVETLDSAIAYTISKDLDTCISAINSPHLSWREKDGRKVPNYEKRLNRQFLPPNYLETGAFVITKGTCISRNSRIGKKVDVYELSQSEAIDVDNFADLRSASSILSEKKVAIYVNGNNRRGIGHIYRALELADEFYVKPVIYYDSNQTDSSVFGKTTHDVKPINGIAELFKLCKQEQYDVFINDILDTSIDYMIALRASIPHSKIINFEDSGEGAQAADLVFNALFNTEGMKHVYNGNKYYICGKSFMFYSPIEIKDSVRRVFVSFGGADPQNYSDRLLDIISRREYAKYEFVVVLGRSKLNVDELLKYNEFEHITVLYDVANMPELMSSCDVGVTSRGRTGYELALLGIPSIAMAQNQREEKHGFVCNNNGFSYIGLNPDDEVIEATLCMYLRMSKETRKHYQEKLLSHDLRNGRKRVMSLINSL